MRGVIRFSIYCAFIWLAFCVQGALSALCPLLGAGLIPALLGCAAIFEAPEIAAFLGFFAGLLCDTLSVSGVFYAFSYGLLCALISFVSECSFFPGLAVCAVSGAALLILPPLAAFAAFYLPFYHMPFAVLAHSLLTRAAAFAPGFFPSYALCRGMQALFHDTQHGFIRQSAVLRLTKLPIGGHDEKNRA